MALAEFRFIDHAEVLHLIGPPGTGKSHLSLALAVEAVKTGRSVYFGALADIISALADAAKAATDLIARLDRPNLDAGTERSLIDALASIAVIQRSHPTDEDQQHTLCPGQRCVAPPEVRLIAQHGPGWRQSVVRNLTAMSSACSVGQMTVAKQQIGPLRRQRAYGRGRYAVQIEGLSHREAARQFGIDPRAVAKMVKFSQEAAGQAEA